MMNWCTVSATLAVLFVVSLVPGSNRIYAQNQDFKVGETVEMYHGRSAFVVKAIVTKLGRNGNITVQYKTPYTSNGTTNATIPVAKVWKVGGEPNPAPKNDYEIGDKVEFYFRRSDQVMKGVVSGIPTSIHYRVTHKGPFNRGTMSASVSVDEMWKAGAKKKPLPAGFRRGSGRGNMVSDPGGNTPAVSGPKPIRKWSSSNGNFEIQARFKSTTGNSVELEKEDGSSITVELDKLSEADNKYVANVGNSDLTRRKVTGKADIPHSKKRLKLTGGDWDFKQDSGELSDYSLPGNSVRMAYDIGFGSNSGRRGNFWGSAYPDANGESTVNQPSGYRFTQWTMAQDGKRCFLIANSTFNQGCLIQGLNFDTGQLDFQEIIDGHGVGISLDGSKVAFLQTGQAEERGELIVKEVGEGGTVFERHVVKAFMDQSGYSPSGGFFMNDSILATIGRRFVAMDIDRGSGYSTTPFPKNAPLIDSALSPNRKVVALVSLNGVFLFDISRGKPVGAIPMLNAASGKIAFSNNGTKLAFCSQSGAGVKVFDLTTGKLSTEIPAYGDVIGKSVTWPHPRFLLVNNESLFDLELGAVIWRFKVKGSFFDPLFHMGGKTFIHNDGNRGLTPVELPLDRIETAANSLSIDDVTVLNEGDDFRIDLDTTFGGQDNQRIRDHFERKMGLRGITYDDDSQNVFYCSVETESEQSAIIKMSGDDTQTVRFRPTTCRIELEINGDLKWQRKQVNSFSGGTLVGQRGESPQQAVTRLCRPEVSAFTIGFPSKFILFPNGKDVLGESIISSEGVADVD